jgi:hypothetical protein
MNKLFSIIFSFILVVFVNTKAKCDRFIFKGDTAYFDVNSPLEQYPGIQELRTKLVGYESEICFDCHPRPYSAEWTVINNELYLTAIL